jgi:hypothetical protein
VPAGKGEDVEMANGLMISEKAWLAIAELASVTLAVNNAVPAVVGVPVSAPAEERVRPAGSAPVAIAQE